MRLSHRTLALALSYIVVHPVVGRAQQPAPATTASSGPPRTIRAVRRSAPVVIDGKLDDAGVGRRRADRRVHCRAIPQPGAAAPDQTEVRVLYDDDAIYVGIRMFDAHPDSIAAGLARRDATAATGIYSDWVHLIIDSYHDRRTAFRFSTTPRGVQKDVYTYNDGNEDLNWDAVWEVGTRVDSLGWVAEYRIPLSQLRFGGDSARRRARVGVPGAARHRASQRARHLDAVDAAGRRLRLALRRPHRPRRAFASPRAARGHAVRELDAHARAGRRGESVLRAHRTTSRPSAAT